jgi:PKD repeat protein
MEGIMNMMRFFPAAATLIAATSIAGVANATSYYIDASTGSDTNDGLTPTTAWLTFGKIGKATFATSDRVYLHSGQQWTIGGLSGVKVTWSGTAASHAVIGAYHTDSAGTAVIGPGTDARPKIVSNYVFAALSSMHTTNHPYDYEPPIEVDGDYVDVQDIEVDNWGLGISLSGTNNTTVTNYKVATSYFCGMLIESSTNITVANSEITGDDVGRGVYGESSWCSAINVQFTTGIVIQNNFIHEGYGEGTDIFEGSKNAVVENNTYFSQRAVGVYADWAQNVDIRDNLILGTSNTHFWRDSTAVGPGIALSNEPYEYTNGSVADSDMLKNINVYDNLVAGTNTGLALWHTGYPLSNGGAFVNLNVYNNTFVDNTTQLLAASTLNSVAENNIFLSISTGTADHTGTSSGTVFHNNYWSGGNPAAPLADSSTDIYSGIVLSQMTGWRSIATASAIPSWSAFAPTSASSTLGRGTALLAAPYNVDYNGNTHRNPMDLGGIAGSGGTTVTAPVAAFSCTPLTGTAPVAVTCTDSSSNSPSAWNWSFGDSGTSTVQNPGHTYVAAGTYTVALTATNSGGSNTATKTGYVTVTAATGSVTPTSVNPGQAITVTDSINPGVTANGAMVVFWLDDSAGNLLGRIAVTNVAFVAGQAKTVTGTFTIPSSAAAGSYTVSATVYQDSTSGVVIERVPAFANFTIN